MIANKKNKFDKLIAVKSLQIAPTGVQQIYVISMHVPRRKLPVDKTISVNSAGSVSKRIQFDSTSVLKRGLTSRNSDYVLGLSTVSAS